MPYLAFMTFKNTSLSPEIPIICEGKSQSRLERLVQPEGLKLEGQRRRLKETIVENPAYHAFRMEHQEI
jgi:hypothetical protein